MNRMNHTTSSLENQRSELLKLMKARSDPSPVPARSLSIIVIDTIEVRSPPRPDLRRNLLQWLQQFVWNKHLRLPPAHFSPGLHRAARDSSCLARLAIALIVPGSPTQKLPSEVGNQNRKLKSQWRNLIFEIDRIPLIRPQEKLKHVLRPQIQKILLLVDLKEKKYQY